MFQYIDVAIDFMFNNHYMLKACGVLLVYIFEFGIILAFTFFVVVILPLQKNCASNKYC